MKRKVADQLSLAVTGFSLIRVTLGNSSYCLLISLNASKSCEHRVPGLMPAAHMLCQICQGCLQGERKGHRWPPPDPPFSFDHHRTGRDVWIAAQKGCHLCSILWDLLTPNERTDVLQASDETNMIDDRHVQLSVLREMDVGEEYTLQISYPLARPESASWVERFCDKLIGLLPAQGKLYGLCACYLLKQGSDILTLT